MSIKVVKGNVLSIDKGIIVHGCNCQGVMGAGIAYAIKNQYPLAFNLYRQQYELSGLKLGEILPVLVSPKKYIMNAMTQNLYPVYKNRNVSYDAIAECFSRVNDFALGLASQSEEQITVAFPAIGAGLGGGDWNILSQIIDSSLSDKLDKVLYVL
jgi:O-acetyl-ADP-ribose deacetylase (regulator of RNase III)